MEETERKLIELLNEIDSKRHLGEYTMNELQNIAEKAIKVIRGYYPNSESINELNRAINLSNDFHKEMSYKNADNIITILCVTKFAIESFLSEAFGYDF